LIQVQLTAADKAGVERVELYDGDPCVDGRLIGETTQIDDNRCTILCEYERVPMASHLLYVRVYDRSGNFEIEKVLVEF